MAVEDGVFEVSAEEVDIRVTRMMVRRMKIAGDGCGLFEPDKCSDDLCEF